MSQRKPWVLEDHPIDDTLPTFTAFLAEVVLSAARDWHHDPWRGEAEGFLLSGLHERIRLELDSAPGQAIVDKLRAGLSEVERDALGEPVLERRTTPEQNREQQRRHYHKRKVRGKNLSLATQLPLLVC